MEIYRLAFSSLILFLQIDIVINAISTQQCFDAISGIFLRQYADPNKDGYSLLFLFPLGGILQLDSNEKVDSNNYYGDATGFYLCNDNSGTKQVDFHTLYITESGNQNVVLTQSSTKCCGALNSCGDNTVLCKNGATDSQVYRAGSLNQNTGIYTESVSAKTTQKFEARRLYTHPIVSNTRESDKCYANLAGVYVTQHSDNSFSLTAYLPLGYFLTFFSNGRNINGEFIRGTNVGTWYCGDNNTISSTSNAFTYPNSAATNGQSIISSTVYMQCPAISASGQYENCAGQLSESYFPFQYNRLPFRDGQPLTSSPPSFKASRLSTQPTIQTCHSTFSGQYIFSFNFKSPAFTAQNNYILYRNALLYAATGEENNPTDLVSNIVGVWNCNANGSLVIDEILFQYATLTRPASSFYINTVYLQCTNNQCVGTVSEDSYPTQLPISGKFSGTSTNTNPGTVTARILDYENY